MKLIVAVDEQWGIGRNNELLFSIPEDKIFFKESTVGKIVVMGHNTLKSLPSSLPLKNRINIILTRDNSIKIAGAIVCGSINQLGSVLSMCLSDEVFVIGGHSIYAQLIDYCDEAYVTKIFSKKNADRFFPNIDAADNWEIIEKSQTKTFDGIDYCFLKYKNLMPKKIEASGCEADSQNADIMP